jgi:hypothetical protein
MLPQLLNGKLERMLQMTEMFAFTRVLKAEEIKCSAPNIQRRLLRDVQRMFVF